MKFEKRYISLPIAVVVVRDRVILKGLPYTICSIHGKYIHECMNASLVTM